jgi:hypothetical protein
MPSSTIIAKNGGSFIINLPFDKVKEMKVFIRLINNDYSPDLLHLKGQIKDTGIEHSTLEEIFLKVNSGS